MRNKIGLILFIAIALSAQAYAQACASDADCVSSGPGFECNASSQCEWMPPIGIPKPAFGIEETYRMYDDPTNRNPDLNYNPNTEGGFYTHYVDNTDPNATDDNNPYGTVNKPRMNLPFHLTGRFPIDPSKWLEPGSIVEIHGGPYDYGPFTSSNGVSVKSDATASMPSFIRGVDSPVMGDYLFYVRGQYTIVEGMKFLQTRALLVPDDYVYTFNSNNIAYRGNEFEGLELVDGQSAINTYGVDRPASDIVIYNNHIHNYGQWYGSGATDIYDSMGIAIKIDSNNIWVLDNHIHHNGGDSVHVGNNSYGRTHHIYIGRNDMHDDRENAIDVKEAQDVIISQNKMYNYLELGRADDGGAAVTHPQMHFTPKNVWWIFNEIYDNSQVAHGSISSYDLYFIGNVIYNIPASLPDSYHSKAFSPFNFVDTERHYYVNNTMYNVEAGIMATVDSPDVSIVIANNIFGSLSEGVGDYWKRHINVDHQPDTATIENNLFYQSDGQAVIGLGGTSYTVAELEALDKCPGCIEQDPMFEDPASDDLSLLAGSPAIDAGTESSVYQTFYNLYGIDIRKDFEGNARPQGSGWDIGAYEFQGSTCTTLEALLGHIQQWEQGSLSMPTLINQIAAWKAGTGCP